MSPLGQKFFGPRNLYEVVTDPALADAIFSDRIGETFEQKYAELYPPPKPLEEEKSDDADKEPKKDDKVQMSTGAVRGASSWARGRGNVYLIDRKSRTVLWSSFRKPKNSTAKEMDRTAAQVVGSLKNDLGLKATGR